MAASVAGESHYVWLEEVATAYFVIVMRARSRARTSRAELFSPHLLVLWPFSSHYVCFQLSAYTLELIYTFKAFVEVPTYSFSFPPPPVSCPVSLLLVVHFRNETVMSCCFIFGSVSFRNETEIWKMGVAEFGVLKKKLREECVCNYDSKINAAMVIWL